MDFIELEISTGLLCDLVDTPHPTRVWGWDDGILELPAGATHFGMVTEGTIVLKDPRGEFALGARMFFAAPGACVIDGTGACGLVISRLDYQGLWQLGGPVEQTGRLCYIDGCSDTLLISPPRLGDPCLNHLHIPPGTSQTAHTHPSERIGIIVRGTGECRTPAGARTLTAGMAWRIPTGVRHSFHTTDSSLDVIAWHPDSDCGPTDSDHPMVSRTIVNGVSASRIDAIKTRRQEDQ